MSDEVLKTLRHIFDARIDNAENADAYTAWTSARDIVEYALADNIECLRQFDYLLTDEEGQELVMEEERCLRLGAEAEEEFWNESY